VVGAGDLELKMRCFDKYDSALAQEVGLFLEKNPEPVFNAEFLELASDYVSIMLRPGRFNRTAVRTALNYCRKAIALKIGSSLRERHHLRRALYLDGSHFCMHLAETSESSRDRVLFFQEAFQYNRGIVATTVDEDRRAKQCSFQSQIATHIANDLKQEFREGAFEWMLRAAVARLKAARIAESLGSSRASSLYNSAANRKYDAFLIMPENVRSAGLLDDAVELGKKAETFAGGGFRAARIHLNLGKFYAQRHHLSGDRSDLGFAIHYYRRVEQFCDLHSDSWSQDHYAPVKETLKNLSAERTEQDPELIEKPGKRKNKKENARKIIEDGLDEYYSR